MIAWSMLWGKKKIVLKPQPKQSRNKKESEVTNEVTETKQDV